MENTEFVGKINVEFTCKQMYDYIDSEGLTSMQCI